MEIGIHRGRVFWSSLIAIGVASFGLFALLPFVHASCPWHDEHNCPAEGVLLGGGLLVLAPTDVTPSVQYIEKLPVCADALTQTHVPSLHVPRGPPA